MKISIVLGDITKLHVDAIVNAANSTLLGGGGVDGAIHSAAGPGLLAECRRIRLDRYPGGLPTGRAVITGGYRLPAKHVIHTVGPIYDKDDVSLLADCYRNSLALAEENRCRSIAFPSVSTGIYGVPIRKAAAIVHRILGAYRPSCLQEVILVLHSKEDYETYRKEFKV